MATQPDKIPCPFADQGDRNSIPESGTLTAASWAYGFPPLTAQPLDYGGEAPKREDINGVLKSLSDHVYYAQAGGVYPYSGDTNYDVPAIVYYPATGEMYLCVQANGPDTVVISPGEDTEEEYWKAMTGGEDGLPAGFGAVSAEASGLEPGDAPTANVTADGPDTAKTFHFKFGIPRGENGEKGDPGGEGDPGEAAGFGTPTASATVLDEGAAATVTVTASGPDTAKIFAFEFGIPKGTVISANVVAYSENSDYTAMDLVYDEEDRNLYLCIQANGPNTSTEEGVEEIIISPHDDTDGEYWRQVNCSYELPVATADTLGGIKVGNNLSITADGVLSAEAEPYELPVATADTLGGIKVGDGLEITTDGTLSATGQGGDYLILTAVPSASDLSDGQVAFVVEAA